MEVFSTILLYAMVVLTSIVSCRFLILFSSAKNNVLYYLIYTAITLAFSVFFQSTNFYLPEIINNIISVLIATLFCKFALKIDFSTAILSSMLTTVVFGIYNIVAFSLSSVLLRETLMSELAVLTLNSVLILLFSTLSLELLIRRYGKHGKWGGKYSILYICPLSFIYFVTGTIISIAYIPAMMTTTIQDLEILLVTGVSLISIYATLYSYEKVMEHIDTQSKMSSLEIYTQMQKQYISEARQKYESTKSFRHDMKNHMTTLARLIDSDETIKAKEYLSRFDEQVTALSFDYTLQTGNAVIDILLKEKLGFAKEQNIKVSCDALFPKDFIVDDFDLCVIFFNALDNAIKGSVHADEKVIDIVAKKNKDFFVIDIMNSFAPLRYEKGLGIGLETIKFITEKYGGFLEISLAENIFRVSIMFLLKQF